MENTLIGSVDLYHLESMAERLGVYLPDVSEVLEEADNLGFTNRDLAKNSSIFANIAFRLVINTAIDSLNQVTHVKIDDIVDYLKERVYLNCLDSGIDSNVNQIIEEFNLDSEDENTKELINILTKILEG